MNKLPFAGFFSTNLYFEPELATASELENAFYPGNWKPAKSGITESVITSLCEVLDPVILFHLKCPKSSEIKRFEGILSFAVSHKNPKICVKSL